MNTTLLRMAGIIITAMSLCGMGWAQASDQSGTIDPLYSRQWLLGVTTPENPQAWPTSVQRLYILDCGNGASDNMENWTPGRNRGKPNDLPAECYLIKDSHGWFLFDTGLPDHLASMSNGWLCCGGIHQTMNKTLMSQLDQLGVKPSDLMGIGLGSDDPTCVGNLELFPDTTVYVAREEYDYYFSHPVQNPAGNPVPTFSPNHPVQLIDEDWDVFNDNSVIMVGTPGHTPGLTGLLIHLPQTGWVFFTDDSIHLRQNFYNDVIPQFRGRALDSRMEILLSMQRIRDLMNFYQAKMVIQHDYDQSKTLKYAPEYYQ